MSTNHPNHTTKQQQPRFGMDVVLVQKGKAVQSGESIRFQLIKGPTRQNQNDPVNPKAPQESFPQLMKFTETVIRPDFSSSNSPWTSARFYQQDIPKVQDDSDEEGAGESTTKTRKKRWRRPDAPRRQWMLQEEKDFFETTIAKRQKKALPADRVSTRYEGVNEHNPSHYVVLTVKRNNNNDTDEMDEDDDEDDDQMPKIQVTTLPPNSHINFSQPANRKTLSMTQAEQAIQDQRGKMTRFMMHKKSNALDVGTSGSGGRLGAGATANGVGGGSKARLLGRLQSNSLKNDNDIDEDDIMGDLRFKSRKGGTSRARKELLTTLGDSNVAVDDDGVLGGTNDAEFGGRRHFGKLNIDKESFSKQHGGGEKGTIGGTAAAGNDGLAMADDFYQRDVKEEYEELDYDANEQFDDDDVDLGESEVIVDTGGFAADGEDEDEDDFVEQEREGAEGLATVAGFRQMLAKARGETVGEQQQQQQQQQSQDGTSTAGASASGMAGMEGGADGVAKKPDGTMGTDGTKNQSSSGVAGTYRVVGVGGDTANATAAVTSTTADGGNSTMASDINAGTDLTPIDKMKASSKKYTGKELDDNGDRLITLEAVRKEIWLRNGAIATKNLMKIFSISKKTVQERKDKFQAAIKELCTFKKDPVEGNMLVLKQHYANMG